MELTIVIPVYNRLTSITRLINSLQSANIENEVDLVISCEANASEDVKEFVTAINWSFGRFGVVHQEKQLGVDAHNLACMQMAKDLGPILILEDDLVVSPYFQAYLNAFDNINYAGIAGIGLYRYSIVEQDHFPFHLIPNVEFVYYQQKACSNGTYYTWEMLKPYFDFLKSFDGKYAKYHLPANVKKWGDEVWEKSFYCYLIENHKYIAYPRYSFTTDFADVGVHMKSQVLKYVHQAPLYLSRDIGPVLSVENTANRYDQFYELCPEVVKQWNPDLLDYDFEMDLYGGKEMEKIAAACVITSRRTVKSLLGWERRLKPEINNVLLNTKGSHYTLAYKEDVRIINENLTEKFLYYFPNTKLSDLLKMKIAEVLSRFTSL